MDNFNYIDIILLLGVSQGIFLSITLLFVREKNGPANTILALQLIMACFMLVSRIGLYKIHDFSIIKWLFLIEPFIFICGPLGYVYLKRLLIRDSQKFNLPWYHYLPSVIYFFYLILILQYNGVTYKNKYFAGDFTIPFFIAEVGALISNLIYLYLCGKLLLYYKENEKEQLSFNQKTISFLRTIYITVALILLAWMLNFISTTLFRYNISVISYNSIWIGVCILIYIIGFYALLQPEIFRVLISKELQKKTYKNRIGEKEISELKLQLEQLMDVEKIYLNNELTLINLANALNTSTNDISWLLNNEYHTNFYDFINQYRIEAFLEKIEKKEHKTQTLLSLSMDVGFNSKSTFNKAFKATLQQTPTSYIKSRIV